MAAVVNTYKATFHYEQGGKTATAPEVCYFQSATGSVDGLRSVLSSNSKLRPGTLVVDSIQEVGHAETAIA